jgi:hypothetical protein
LRLYGRVNSAASIDRAGVRTLLSAHKTASMNAIAAHKHELERLLEKLSGDIAFSKISFLALVDAYITRLDTNWSDISARVNLSPARINGEFKMEATLTQNCALYYAQHKTSERGATFSRKFRDAARKRAILSRSAYATSFSGVYRHHRGNSR